MRGPSQGEDTKNVSLISIAAAVALIATVAFIADSAPSPIDFGTSVPAPAITPTEPWIDGPALDGRLFGRVSTRSGETYEGYLRWDRNEGAWTDLLDATKEGRTATISGIRFGHVAQIEILDSHSALLTLRSGEEQLFSGRATDLGSGLRALQIDDARQGLVELEWNDLQAVTFAAAPDGSRPRAERLYGTMVTRRGQEFTGYVTWDVDEIYTTDILDGEVDGVEEEVVFGEIVSIERINGRSARVRLASGEQLTMSGGNDVDASNRGISISDVNLGQVSVEWNEFSSVTLFDAPVSVGYAAFDGGTPLYGTVTLASGDQLSGDLVWDNDEAFTWEMLNGESDDVEFHLEFGNIATIERFGRGVMVGLHDGRSFEVWGSNDVNSGNRGILVKDESGSIHRIAWDAFRSVRFTRKSLPQSP